jgi:hypothetical protein
MSAKRFRLRLSTVGQCRSSLIPAERIHIDSGFYADLSRILGSLGDSTP